MNDETKIVDDENINNEANTEEVKEEKDNGFKPITTQEEFNSALHDRIQREKNQRDKLNTQIADLTKSLSDRDRSIEELNAKVAKYETASVKSRIAAEAGLPGEFAERLTGEDEKAWKKDAENLARYFKNRSYPRKETEEPAGNPEQNEMKNLLRKLRGE